MTIYSIEFDIATRYRCRISADGPQEAIEEFWLRYDDDGLNEVEIDSSGPTGISVTDASGNPAVVGPSLSPTT